MTGDWDAFFDDEYYQVWHQIFSESENQRDADTLVELMALTPGQRVLDAPCGFGRMSVPLAQRGLELTGLDMSEAMLARARERAVASDGKPLCFVHADLEAATLDIDTGFDGAVHLFSSLGYRGEDGDRRALCNIRGALREGARFFLETMHRDAIVCRLARNDDSGGRGTGGLVMRERHDFDLYASRLKLRWTWTSPTLAGSREAEMRIYSVPELFSLLEDCGFAIESCFAGISRQELSASTLDRPAGILAVAV